MQCLPAHWRSSLIPGLQIYYPYFYLLRLARNVADDSVKSQASLNVEQITLLSSVTAALIWALWLNVRCLLLSLQILATLSKYNIGAFGPSGDREGNWPEEDAGPLVPEHQLDTMPDIGLNLREVEGRRRLYGYNEVTPPDRVFWNSMKYLRACVENLTVPLGITTLPALVLSHWLDALVIIGLLTQRLYIIKRHLDSTTEHLVPNAFPEMDCQVTVVRESIATQIAARDLLPGDILVIHAENLAKDQQRIHIPAECRLLIAPREVVVDQSNITNESLCVNKSVGDILLYASLLVHGDALAIVLCSAQESYAARTARAAVLQRQKCTPTGVTANQKHTIYSSADFDRVSNAICAVKVIASVFVIGALWISQLATTSQHLVITLLGLAILIEPNAEELVGKTVRAAGVDQMAEKGAIVQYLADGVDLLAGIDTLCCDKTGIMSQNNLQIGRPFCLECTDEDLMLNAGLTLPPGPAIMDPIDRAFSVALHEYPSVEAQIAGFQTLSYQPFDADSKIIRSTVRSASGDHRICVRGAPKAVLNICSDTSEADARLIKDQVLTLARRGFCMMGVASSQEDCDLAPTFLGLIPIDDPPRADTSSAIKRARQLGIDVKMLTGDVKAIASKNAMDFGLSGSNVFNATSLTEGSLEDPLPQSEHCSDPILVADTYCEVFPEHKLAITRALQQAGRVEAGTGAGPSDVATLKQADCGIGPEGAAIDAQSAADVVFLKPGISTIITNIELSRKNFRKRYMYRLCRTSLTLYLIFTLTRLLLRRDCSISWLILMTTSVLMLDTIGIHFSWAEDNFSCPAVSCRWNMLTFLQTTVVLTICLTSATALVEFTAML